MVPDSDLNAFEAFAQQLADESRRMLFEAAARQLNVEVKADKSLVTELDLAIEARLRQMIADRFPHHGVVGEEQDAKLPDADFVWILDPIDGTAPFIAGIPVYGTLIALAHGVTPILGIAELPATGDRWCGTVGRNTTRNGSVCRTRACSALSDAMLSTSNPDFYAPHEIPVLDDLRAATRWRIYGGSAMSYGLLASGRIDVAVDTRLKIHDFACFRPIIEGAGGVITDWNGQPITLRSGPQILAAGDSRRHRESLARIAAILP